MPSSWPQEGGEMTEIKPEPENCTCPIQKSGKYLRGIFNNHDGNWINIDCPLHGVECTYCGKINCKGEFLAYKCGG